MKISFYSVKVLLKFRINDRKKKEKVFSPSFKNADLVQCKKTLTYRA